MSLLDDYLNHTTDAPGRHSTLSLALWDCRRTTGRDERTGQFTDPDAPHALTWLAALGYLCVLDQLGSVIELVAPTPAMEAELARWSGLFVPRTRRARLSPADQVDSPSGDRIGGALNLISREFLVAAFVVQAAVRYSLMSPPPTVRRSTGWPDRDNVGGVVGCALVDPAVGAVLVVVVDVLDGESPRLRPVRDSPPRTVLRLHGPWANGSRLVHSSNLGAAPTRR